MDVDLKRRILLIVLVMSLVTLSLTFRPAALEKNQQTLKGVDFNRDIRPILSDNCFFCHGLDEQQRMVGLRLDLDTKDGAFADRGGYRVIVPGNAAGSRLFQRINANDETRMPPLSSERSFTSAGVAGRPVKSNVTRRNKVILSASAEGLRCSL